MSLPEKNTRQSLSSVCNCIEQKGLNVYAWTIMTNHIHLIISSHDQPPENILGSHKHHTSEMLDVAIAGNAGERGRE